MQRTAINNPPPTPAPHLLVVDDEEPIRSLIERYFSAQGFQVSQATNGATLRTSIVAEPIDIVLLDLGLPGENGLDLTRWLREHWGGAIIILTGRGESVDRVVGLELGADDYVTKPFELRELLARVRSVMRRAVAPAATANGSTFEFAGLKLDTASRALIDRSGVEIALTSGEYDLLRVLLEHPNRALSRDRLMSHLHDREAGPYDRAIDVQIGRLRRKIDNEPGRPELIKSVRGVGYLLATHVQRV